MAKVYLKDVKPGDVLVTDGGFTCMNEGERRTVHSVTTNGETELYIECRDGHHFLVGQEHDDGSLVGLTRA